MREKLIELIQESVGGCARNWAKVIATHLIANGATIPVRCWECKMFCRNYAHKRKHCGLTGAIVEDDDFCSFGERGTNEKDSYFV